MQSVIWHLILFMSLWGFAVCDWSCAVEFTNYGGPYWGIDNNRPFNYLSDFAENWLKGFYMCQDDTCEIISELGHPLNSYDQKSKCSIYVYLWMRHIRFRVKILAASNTEHTQHCTWALSLHLCR